MPFMGKPYGKLECYYILGVREGIVVPEEGRFMGKGLNFCLDIFDYQEYSKEEIVKKCRITPAILESNAEYERQRLVDESKTPCFFVEKLKVCKDCEIIHNQKFTIGVVCSGSCVMEAGTERLKLSKGDSFVIAAAADTYRILTGEGSEICIVYPGADMESR